jgi:hypothetical protein
MSGDRGGVGEIRAAPHGFDSRASGILHTDFREAQFYELG